MSSKKIEAGICPNCGVVSGDSVDFGFPEPAKCNDCDEELNEAGVVDESVITNN